MGDEGAAFWCGVYYELIGEYKLAEHQFQAKNLSSLPKPRHPGWNNSYVMPLAVELNKVGELPSARLKEARRRINIYAGIKSRGLDERLKQLLVTSDADAKRAI